MGQKVHPIGLRVGIIRDWDAKWYAEKEYADYLHEDLAIRKFVQKELLEKDPQKENGIARIRSRPYAMASEGHITNLITKVIVVYGPW